MNAAIQQIHSIIVSPHTPENIVQELTTDSATQSATIAFSSRTVTPLSRQNIHGFLQLGYSPEQIARIQSVGRQVLAETSRGLREIRTIGDYRCVLGNGDALVLLNREGDPVLQGKHKSCYPAYSARLCKVLAVLHWHDISDSPANPLSSEQRLIFNRENQTLEDLQRLHTPRIPKYYGKIEIPQFYATLLELYQTDLMSWFQFNTDVMEQPKQSCKTILTIALQIIGGLRTLHQNGFAHGDIKIENIIIKNHPILEVAITDFDSLQSVTDLQIVKGTIDYLPPEAIAKHLVHVQRQADSSDPIDMQKVDMWGFGTILLSLLSGGRAAADLQAAVRCACRRILETDLPISILHERLSTLIPAIQEKMRAHYRAGAVLTDPHHLPPSVLQLGSRLLHINPKDRPDADEAYAILSTAYSSVV